MMLYFAVIAVLTAVLLPWRRSFLTRVRRHLVKLHPNQLDELIEFILGGPRAHDMTFWSRVGGISGLFVLLRDSYHLLGIIQACAAEGYLDPTDATYIWWRAAAQAALTIIAIPEAAVCHIFGIRHLAARQSVKFYCEIVMRSNTLLDTLGLCAP